MRVRSSASSADVRSERASASDDSKALFGSGMPGLALNLGELCFGRLQSVSCRRTDPCGRFSTASSVPLPSLPGAVSGVERLVGLKDCAVRLRHLVLSVAAVERQTRYRLVAALAFPDTGFGGSSLYLGVVILVVEANQKVAGLHLIVGVGENLDNLAADVARDPDLAVLRFDAPVAEAAHWAVEADVSA